MTALFEFSTLDVVGGMLTGQPGTVGQVGALFSACGWSECLGPRPKYAKMMDQT